MNNFTNDERLLLATAGFKRTWAKGCYIRESIGFFQIVYKKKNLVGFINNGKRTFLNPSVHAVIKSANFQF